MHEGTRAQKRGSAPMSAFPTSGARNSPLFLFLYQDIRNPDKQWLIPHWPSSLPRFPNPVPPGQPTSSSAQLRALGPYVVSRCTAYAARQGLEVGQLQLTCAGGDGRGVGGAGEIFPLFPPCLGWETASHLSLSHACHAGALPPCPVCT